MDLLLDPSSLQGTLHIPSSKSHTLRAILFASLARGRSTIYHPLPSPDTKAMIQAVQLLGALVDGSDPLYITGCDGTLQGVEDVIQCGNSGQVLRFIGALAGLIPHYTILTGDASLRYNRPVAPLLNGLQQLGAFAVSSRGNGHAPIAIKGPLLYDKATIDGQDSQPVSGLLIAAAFAPHPIAIQVVQPGEKPWVELTLSWFRKLGIPYQANDYSSYTSRDSRIDIWDSVKAAQNRSEERGASGKPPSPPNDSERFDAAQRPILESREVYQMVGNGQIDSFAIQVPGDFSSAAFPIAAALVTGSELTLCNLDMEDVQGDKQIISILQKMGASFHIERDRITVQKGGRLQGMRIDVNDCIDALPILAVIGCYAEGVTEIVGGAIARRKESDRIGAIAMELKKMGALIEEREDGLLIEHSLLRGAVLDSHCDHRIALSLLVAALGAHGRSQVREVEWIKKSYPTFLSDFLSIGATMQEV